MQATEVSNTDLQARAKVFGHLLAALHKKIVQL
jgi:hypothetical protein